MSSNTDLTADVSDELFWDPKLDSTAIAVSSDGGAITMRGTVGSFREKREAQKAAQRDDADLRGDVLQALMLDSIVPTSVDAKVDEGFVTLTGTANWQYQRDEAEFVASNIVGVVDVFDEIKLEYPKPTRNDVQHSIKKAFKRNAGLDAKDLSISTNNGSVTVTGTVNSWAEHDEAIDAAWSAPGVTSVRDDLTVAY